MTNANNNKTDKNAVDDTPTPTPEKDVDEWVTGDEPMTGPQRSYVHTLAREAGEEVPDDMSKAETSKKIDELQRETGRGRRTTRRRTRPMVLVAIVAVVG